MQYVIKNHSHFSGGGGGGLFVCGGRGGSYSLTVTSVEKDKYCVSKILVVYKHASVYGEIRLCYCLLVEIDHVLR